MAESILQGLEFVVVASAVAWLIYVVYEILYHPQAAFKLLPARLRSWSLLKQLGVTDRSPTFMELEDRFYSLQEITKAMRTNGLDKANLMIGIDFTASNEWQGRKTFGGRSLHHIAIDPKSGKVSKWNPYQKVIRTIGETLQDFDEDQLIPVFGFGDEKTRDQDVFPLLNDTSPCRNVDEVLTRYIRTVGSVQLSGPTSFAPIIRKAIDIVRETGKYHVLLILADGRVENDQDMETRKAIVEASHYPLSIVLVGLGDGPWDTMHLYDDKIPQRRFDNFQFVEYNDKNKSKFSRDDFESEFALQALMEIPDQYKAIKSLGLLKENRESPDLNRNKRTKSRKDSVNKHAKNMTAKETDV